MFEPISARLASSCSRNGISAVATDQICVGETSIRSTCFGDTATTSPSAERQSTCGPLEPLRLRVDLGVGLRDRLLLLLGGVQVDDLVGDHAVLDHPVRGGHEPVLGDLGVGGQRADQADVRALGGLDRAHAAVVGGMDVANLDRRPLAGQAAGAERREAAPVGEAGERVRLVHELRQLRGAEELLQRRDDGRMLMIVCGVIASESSVVSRSRTTRSIRYRPTRKASWISSPTVRRRRLPKCSYSSRWSWIGSRG